MFTTEHLSDHSLQNKAADSALMSPGRLLQAPRCHQGTACIKALLQNRALPSPFRCRNGYILLCLFLMAFSAPACHAVSGQEITHTCCKCTYSTSLIMPKRWQTYSQDWTMGSLQQGCLQATNADWGASALKMRTSYIYMHVPTSQPQHTPALVSVQGQQELVAECSYRTSVLETWTRLIRSQVLLLINHPVAQKGIYGWTGCASL